MKQEEHFVGKVAQKAVIHRDGKVLLTKDPRTPATWELPGGRLNVDENPKNGLQRELFEELGVECDIGEVIFLKQFRHGIENNQLSLVLVYTANMKVGANITVDPREIIEYGWFSKEETSGLKLFSEYKEALETFFLL